MQPEIHVFGVSIKTFGVCFALAFIAAGATVQRRLVELGKSSEWAYEMVFAAAVGGLVGSRLYYLIQNYNDVRHDLVGNIFSGAGLVWYGGLIGGAIGVCFWAWRRDFLGLTLLDVCAPALAIGYAIGRIGCQVSGDGDYGKPWNGPWAMSYPNGTVPTTQTVHPTPIYETVAMGLVTWWLWRDRDAFRPGVLFAWYLVLAGLERFLVEFIRRNADVVAGLTTPQLESVAVIVAGVVWLLVVRHRHGGIRRPAQQDRVPALAS
jgi:phosphatidylglycerol---prolipoprotein diacylglyceryl transferase